jgi:tetratricopeptide (TPR) repeat protein
VTPFNIVASSPHEWAKTGRILFTKKLFEQAVLCFERAGQPLERDISSAYFLRQKVRIAFPRGRTNDPAKLSEAYREVAEAFLDCARRAPTENQRLRCYRLAGDSFDSGNLHKRAGDAYVEAQEFTLGVKHLRKAEYFDDSIRVIREHRSDIEPEVAEEIWDTAKIYYLQRNKFE